MAQSQYLAQVMQVEQVADRHHQHSSQLSQPSPIQSEDLSLQAQHLRCHLQAQVAVRRYLPTGRRVAQLAGNNRIHP